MRDLFGDSDFESDLTPPSSEKGTRYAANKCLGKHTSINGATPAQNRKPPSVEYVEAKHAGHFRAQTRRKKEEESSEDELTLDSGDPVARNTPKMVSRKNNGLYRSRRRIISSPTSEMHSDHEDRVANDPSSFNRLKNSNPPHSNSSEDTVRPLRGVQEHGGRTSNRGRKPSHARRVYGRRRGRGSGRGRDNRHVSPVYSPETQKQIDYELAVLDEAFPSPKKLQLHYINGSKAIVPTSPSIIHDDLEPDPQQATSPATNDSATPIRRRGRRPSHPTSDVPARINVRDTRHSSGDASTRATAQTPEPLRLRNGSSLSLRHHDSLTTPEEVSSSNSLARRSKLNRQTQSSSSNALDLAPQVVPEATLSTDESSNPPTVSSGLKIRLPPRLGENGIRVGKSTGKGNIEDELESNSEEMGDFYEDNSPPFRSPVIPPTPSNTPQPDVQLHVPAFTSSVAKPRARTINPRTKARAREATNVVDRSTMVSKRDATPWPPGEAEAVLEAGYQLVGLSFTGSDPTSSTTTSIPSTHLDAILRNGFSSADLSNSALSNIPLDQLEIVVKMMEFILQEAVGSRENLERIQNYDLSQLDDKDGLLAWAAQRGFINTGPSGSVPEESQTPVADINPEHSPSSSTLTSTIRPISSDSNTQSTVVQPLDTAALSNSEDLSDEGFPMDISPRKMPRRSPLKSPMRSTPFSAHDLAKTQPPSLARDTTSLRSSAQRVSVQPLDLRGSKSPTGTTEMTPRPLLVLSPTARANLEVFESVDQYDPEPYDEMSSLDQNGYRHVSNSSTTAPMLTIAQIRRPLSVYVPPQPSLAIPHGLTIGQASEYFDYLAQVHAEPYLKMREEVANTVVGPDMSSWAMVRDGLVSVSMGYGRMDEGSGNNAANPTRAQSPDSRGESSVVSLLNDRKGGPADESPPGTSVVGRSPLLAYSNGKRKNSGSSASPKAGEPSPFELQLSTVSADISTPSPIPRHIVQANVAASLKARAEIDELRIEKSKLERAWMKQPETDMTSTTSEDGGATMEIDDASSAVETSRKEDSWLFEKMGYMLAPFMQRPWLSYRPLPTETIDSVYATPQTTPDLFQPGVVIDSPTSPTLVNADHFESHPPSFKASLIKDSPLSRPTSFSIRQPQSLSNPTMAYRASKPRDVDPSLDQYPGTSSRAVLSIPDRSVTIPLTALSTPMLPQPTFIPAPPTNPKKVLSPTRRFSHVEVRRSPHHIERCKNSNWSKILGPPYGNFGNRFNDDSEDELVFSSTSYEPPQVIRSNTGPLRKRKREVISDYSNSEREMDEDDEEFLPLNKSPIKSPSKRMKLENGSFAEKDEIPTAIRRGPYLNIPTGQNVDDVHISASDIREAIGGATQLCHNCRNSHTANLSKARCGNARWTDNGDRVRCGKVFCPRCLQTWYGLDDDAITFLVNKNLNPEGEMGTGLGFGIVDGEWICPFCCDQCMCTVCARKRGGKRERFAPSSRAVFKKGIRVGPDPRRRATITSSPDQEESLDPSQAVFTRGTSTSTSSLPVNHAQPRKRIKSLQVSSAWQVMVPTPTAGLAPKFYEATRPRTRDFPTGAPPPTAAHFTPIVVKHGSELERDGLEDHFTCSEGETGEGKGGQNSRRKRVKETEEMETNSGKEKRINYAVVIPGRKLPPAKKIDVVDLTKSIPSSPSPLLPSVSSPGLPSLTLPPTMDSLIHSLDELAVFDKVIEPEEIHGSSHDPTSTRESSQQPTEIRNSLSAFSLDAAFSMDTVGHPSFGNSFLDTSAKGTSTTPIRSTELTLPLFSPDYSGEAPWRNWHTREGDVSRSPSPYRTPLYYSSELDDQLEPHAVVQAVEPTEEAVGALLDGWLAD